MKAHDAEAQRSGHLNGVGSVMADHLAKEASSEASLTHVPDLRFAYVVLVHDASGALVSDVALAVPQYLWDCQRRAWLYPDGLELD